MWRTIFNKAKSDWNVIYDGVKRASDYNGLVRWWFTLVIFAQNFLMDVYQPFRMGWKTASKVCSYVHAGKRFTVYSVDYWHKNSKYVHYIPVACGPSRLVSASDEIGRDVTEQLQSCIGPNEDGFVTPFLMDRQLVSVWAATKEDGLTSNRVFEGHTRIVI